MNSKSTYTLVFLLSFMATMETQSYALPQTSNAFDYLKVQVDQKSEETKKTLASANSIIVKKVYVQAALLKSKIAFLTKKQYQNKLIAKGYDLNSSGTSKNTVKIAHINTSCSTYHVDFTTILSV